jgi:threonine synthase
MTTRSAPNCLVLGIEGNFDDAQRIAKHLLTDPGSRRSFAESGNSPCSANSINIGRLAPQIAYYVHAGRELAALGLVDAEGRFDVAVPSGNFGNVLAARYAKEMGLPIGSFLVATNRNRILADFLATGIYDRNRPFLVTTSPSMDILVSSNLERLLFEATGRDFARTASLMAELATKGRYELSERERLAFSDFRGASADEGASSAEISRLFEATGYLLDPHTATAAAALRAAGTLRPTLLVATASPFKFAATVSAALGLTQRTDEFDAIEALAERAKMTVPSQLSGLRQAVERHDRRVAPEGVEAAILSWLSGKS